MRAFGIDGRAHPMRLWVAEQLHAREMLNHATAVCATRWGSVGCVVLMERFQLLDSKDRVREVRERFYCIIIARGCGES